MNLHSFSLCWVSLEIETVVLQLVDEIPHDVHIVGGDDIGLEGDLLDLAASSNIIVKSGAWYAYQGQKIGQGRENAKQFLIDNPDIYNEIDKLVRSHYFAKAEEDNTEGAKPATETKGSKSKIAEVQ